MFAEVCGSVSVCADHRRAAIIRNARTDARGAANSQLLHAPLPAKIKGGWSAGFSVG